MKNSKSFSTKLSEALKNDEEAIKDSNLINEAVQYEFYREASQLIIKDFPSRIPILQILLNRIYIPIENNQEDFYSLILTFILQFDRREIDFNGNSYFIKHIPPANINFALVISIYNGRYYKTIDINSQISHYIPNSLKFKFNSEFLSVKVLQVQFFDFLNEKSVKLHLKQAKPSQEFIFAEDRGNMCTESKKISNICIDYCNSKNDDQFFNSICSLLDNLLTMFSNVIEKGKNHSISMIARESSNLFVNGISKVAKKVSELYISKAINSNSDSISAILQSIQDNILQKLSVNYQEAIILAELIAILYKKQDKPGSYEKYAQILTNFNTQILKFEKNFREDKQFKTKYNICISYPKKRNDFLHDPKTETSKSLIQLGKSLKYVNYITEASFVDSVMHLERYEVVDGMIEAEVIQKLEQQANDRFNHHFSISEKITKFLKEMKTFSFIDYPLQNFVFDDDFPRYQFHESLQLGNATIEDIHQIFMQKIDLKSILPLSVLSTKIPKCLICKKFPVQRICEHCGKFVTCQKCASKGCPICQNQLPSLS
ncbi:hypothetical protein M9Y10_035240 [Tritrichomonas musculus]|uniref:RING-type domain-containing protein n=1 Tax=Tritrichomonas musculus TaxID=1915356 RepID=A0ABR2KHA6_9EUKA